MSNILHIVNQSPSERPALASCLRVASDGDSILLIEDGVYAALQSSPFNQHSGSRHSGNGHSGLADSNLTLFALQPDLKARGLHSDELIKGIEVIDYAGFVDLVAASSVSQSWL